MGRVRLKPNALALYARVSWIKRCATNLYSVTGVLPQCRTALILRPTTFVDLMGDQIEEMLSALEGITYAKFDLKKRIVPKQFHDIAEVATAEIQTDI